MSCSFSNSLVFWTSTSKVSSEKITIVTSKAFLADDNLGDSLDGVEALIRKHEDFDKSFAAQAEKINVSAVFIPQCTCTVLKIYKIM